MLMDWVNITEKVKFVGGSVKIRHDAGRLAEKPVYINY